MIYELDHQEAKEESALNFGFGFGFGLQKYIVIKTDLGGPRRTFVLLP